MNDVSLEAGLSSRASRRRIRAFDAVANAEREILEIVATN